MKCEEVIKDSAWVVEDLLTYEECQQFINNAVKAGIHNTTSKGDIRHRNSTTVGIDDVEMSQKIYDRIKDYIPQEVIVDKDCTNDGLCYNKEQIYGTWVPYGLNTRWRVACYPGIGHFGPHRDGCHFVDENHRSLITINGYLTDRPIGFGGATRFVKDSLDLNLDEDTGIFTTTDDDVLHRVEADKHGKAVVFFHDLMHDGEPLKENSPPKWLFRTEIMFERDPETAPQLTSQEREARDFVKRAELAEEEGNISEAIRLYKRAYRLDSSLDSSNVVVS
jgi:hypothetical protein